MSAISSTSTSAVVSGGGFSAELVEEREGFVSLRVTGKGALKTFAEESGGHRWQRTPPTERKGRIHTSTVTVAILPEPSDVQVHIEDKDITVTTMRGSGAGGQHRNKTDSAVLIKHLPTGLQVRVESERSQHQNKALALSVLRARLFEAEAQRQDASLASNRKSQVGSGQRGDKSFTYRTQEGIVTCHATGQKWPLKSYLRGEV